MTVASFKTSIKNSHLSSICVGTGLSVFDNNRSISTGYSGQFLSFLTLRCFIGSDSGFLGLWWSLSAFLKGCFMV
jgi:hypothetical protein